jgi:hypothetical protein
MSLIFGWWKIVQNLRMKINPKKSFRPKWSFIKSIPGDGLVPEVGVPAGLGSVDLLVEGLDLLELSPDLIAFEGGLYHNGSLHFRTKTCLQEPPIL